MEKQHARVAATAAIIMMTPRGLAFPFSIKIGE